MKKFLCILLVFIIVPLVALSGCDKKETYNIVSTEDSITKFYSRAYSAIKSFSTQTGRSLPSTVAKNIQDNYNDIWNGEYNLKKINKQNMFATIGFDFNSHNPELENNTSQYYGVDLSFLSDTAYDELKYAQFEKPEKNVLQMQINETKKSDNNFFLPKILKIDNNQETEVTKEDYDHCDKIVNLLGKQYIRLTKTEASVTESPKVTVSEHFTVPTLEETINAVADAGVFEFKTGEDIYRFKTNGIQFNSEDQKQPKTQGDITVKQGNKTYILKASIVDEIKIIEFWNTDLTTVGADLIIYYNEDKSCIYFYSKLSLGSYYTKVVQFSNGKKTSTTYSQEVTPFTNLTNLTGYKCEYHLYNKSGLDLMGIYKIKYVKTNGYLSIIKDIPNENPDPNPRDYSAEFYITENNTVLYRYQKNQKNPTALTNFIDIHIKGDLTGNMIYKRTNNDATKSLNVNNLTLDFATVDANPYNTNITSMFAYEYTTNAIEAKQIKQKGNL